MVGMTDWLIECPRPCVVCVCVCVCRCWGVRLMIESMCTVLAQAWMCCLDVLTLRNERVCSGVLLQARAHRVRTGWGQLSESCRLKGSTRDKLGAKQQQSCKEKNGKKIWNKLRRIYATKPVDEIFLWLSLSEPPQSHCLALCQFFLSTYLVSNILALAHMCCKALSTSVCSTLQSCFVIFILIQHHVLRIPFSCSTFNCNPVCSLASTSWTW